MNTQKQFSLLKGYSFRFEDESNVIDLWFSSFSGKEKVFANSQLIAQRINLSRNSSASFEIQGDSYKTTMDVISIIRGPYVCSLFKNEELIGRQQLAFWKQDQKPPWYASLWFVMSIGAIMGVFSAVLQIPFWLGLAAFGVLCVIGVRQMKPRIEVVEIEKL